jgi:cellobiose-specific phosphotransferase system component IIC
MKKIVENMNKTKHYWESISRYQWPVTGVTPKSFFKTFHPGLFISAINKIREGWIYLLVDVIFGLFSFLIFHYINNEIVMNPIIQRFINRQMNINNHELYNNGQNIHTSSIQESIKQSIINLLNDKY